MFPKFLTVWSPNLLNLFSGSKVVNFPNFPHSVFTIKSNGVEYYLKECSSFVSSFCFQECVRSVASVMSDSLGPNEQESTRLLCPWDSPGKNTGVRCHALLQDIFPTQGSNLSLKSPALAARFFFTTRGTWEALDSK